MVKYILLFLLTACATTPEPDTSEVYPDVDPELMYYVKRFEFEYKRSIPYVKLKFDFLERIGGKLASGVCIRNTANSSEDRVLINVPIWERLNLAEREQLIFHELGHCVLKRRHISARMRNGCPVSLMYPTGFHNNCYEKYYTYYMNELFMRKPRKRREFKERADLY